MLELLIGRAGSGKTATCLRQALEELQAGGPDGPPLVLLCPEQATYQMERALLDGQTPGTACVRLAVLSFRRLTHRILEEHGGPAHPEIDEAGRRMLLSRLIQEARPHLRHFGPSALRPGLASALARQLAELEAYGADPEALRSCASQVSAQTSARLLDLARLLEAYRTELSGRLADPGGSLAAAASVVAATRYAGASVWVDGFSGFTPREEDLLSALVGCGAQVRLTLCLDSRTLPPGPLPEPEPDHPFAPTWRTLRRMRRRHPGARLQTLDVAVPHRFAPSSTLARLEANWRGEDLEGTRDGDVRLYAAADPADEAEAAADEIDRLCREEGLRYRDVAVIVRDLEPYHDRLAAAFARRDIPCFIDHKPAVAPHPVARALLAALAVPAAGWTLAAVARYLHTDLCGLSRDEGDELEEAALAMGLDGPAWLHPLAALGSGAAARRDRDRLERLRRRLVAPLKRLAQTLSAPTPAREAAGACRALLEAVGAEAWVERQQREDLAEGQPERAQWHGQCWQAIRGLIDSLAGVLGDRSLGASELADSLRAGLEGLRVGLVPPRLDQVLCGGVNRSRHPELQAVFLLGLGEGLFPHAPGEGTLLPDAAREEIRRVGLELAPTSAQGLLDEAYLGYIAATRPSRRLYLSHPLDHGPSVLWHRLAAAAGVCPTWGPAAGPTARRGLAALAAELAAEFRRFRDEGSAPPPVWQGAKAWLAQQPQGLAWLTRAMAGLTPAEPRRLDPELAERLYAPEASPTALETAAACPYRHFAAHGLRLQPRRPPGIDPQRHGQLVHAALARWVEGLRRAGRDPADTDAAQARRFAEDALDQVRPRILDGALPDARDDLGMEAVRRDVQRGVEAVIAHARAGAFRPSATEWSFRQAGLRGRVDRIDEAVLHGRRLLRVIDYKTGDDRLTLERFWHALTLQPVLYLTVASDGRGAEPAGCFLLPVRTRLQTTPGPEGPEPRPPRLQGVAPADQEVAALHESALDGAVTGVRRKKDGTPYANSLVAGRQGFDLLRGAAARRATRLRAAAAAGRIAPAPYRLGQATACDVCVFRDVCGLDPDAGDRPRTLERIRASDAWGRLEQEERREGGVPLA